MKENERLKDEKLKIQEQMSKQPEKIVEVVKDEEHFKKMAKLQEESKEIEELIRKVLSDREPGKSIDQD